MPAQTKQGTVVAEGNKFFLEVEGQRQTLPAGGQLDARTLKALSGQKVQVVFGEAPLLAVIPVAGGQEPTNPILKKRWILCYRPASPLLDLGSILVSPEETKQIVAGLVKAQAIPEDIGAEIINNVGMR